MRVSVCVIGGSNCIWSCEGWWVRCRVDRQSVCRMSELVGGVCPFFGVSFISYIMFSSGFGESTIQSQMLCPQKKHRDALNNRHLLHRETAEEDGSNNLHSHPSHQLSLRCWHGAILSYECLFSHSFIPEYTRPISNTLGAPLACMRIYSTWWTKF